MTHSRIEPLITVLSQKKSDHATYKVWQRKTWTLCLVISWAVPSSDLRTSMRNLIKKHHRMMIVRLSQLVKHLILHGNTSPLSVQWNLPTRCKPLLIRKARSEEHTSE